MEIMLYEYVWRRKYFKFGRKSVKFSGNKVNFSTHENSAGEKYKNGMTHLHLCILMEILVLINITNRVIIHICA